MSELIILAVLLLGIFIGAWCSGFFRPVIRALSAGQLCRDAPASAKTDP